MGRSSSLVAPGIYAPDETLYLAGFAAGTVVLVDAGAAGLLEGVGIAIVLAIVGTILTFRFKQG